MKQKKWWPSKYGPDDQIGMLNEIGPDKVIKAIRLVTQGKTYDLGRTLDKDIPVFPGRSYTQTLVTSAHIINKRKGHGGKKTQGWKNKVNWITELASSTFQLGTHVDGLNHLQIGDLAYNGNSLDDIAEEWGTNKLGIDTMPQVITKGVLLDIASLKGVAKLKKGYVITVKDAESAMEKESVEIQRGDAVLFHTGWGGLWMKDNTTYLSGEPGPGMGLAGWLVRRGVSITGCDTWSYGPMPPEDPDEPFVVPQTLNVKHGMFVVENLHTGNLARDKVHEYMFVLTHPKIRGATGAWVSPVAVV